MEKKMNQLLQSEAAEEQALPEILDTLEEFDQVEKDLDDRAYMAIMVGTYQIYVSGYRIRLNSVIWHKIELAYANKH